MTAWHPVSRPCQQCLAPAFRIASRQGEQIADGFLYLPNNLIAVVLATLTCSVPSPAPRQQGCKGSKPPGSEHSPCAARHVQPAHELPDTYALRLRSQNRARQTRSAQKSTQKRRAVALEVKGAPAAAELPCERRQAGLTAWQTPPAGLPEIETSTISCCFGIVFLRFLFMNCKAR